MSQHSIADCKHICGFGVELSIHQQCAQSSAGNWCMTIIYPHVNGPNQLYKHLINGIEYLQLNIVALHTRHEYIQSNLSVKGN